MPRLLFNVILEMVMALADLDEEEVLVSGARISNLYFADDITLLANGQSELQYQISNVPSASTIFGLEIHQL